MSPSRGPHILGLSRYIGPPIYPRPGRAVPGQPTDAARTVPGTNPLLLLPPPPPSRTLGTNYHIISTHRDCWFIPSVLPEQGKPKRSNHQLSIDASHTKQRSGTRYRMHRLQMAPDSWNTESRFPTSHLLTAVVVVVVVAAAILFHGTHTCKNTRSNTRRETLREQLLFYFTNFVIIFF